ncbi:bifunctional (p)ppGpp synthetase/guanosine-3',5'-bis(diphosphate) 3'-pyrophosphohydrolase [Candidatus Jorgensenbacteria bacterium]|nr:bifunctional (p)ppGpp synthetase/guanosine-3',5'-bis(diphosphate) 3'-pyrophosphohydrolase [Candidatus Jorgensenbacteria bacterium]
MTMPKWLEIYNVASLPQKAYIFAEEAHKDAKRANGDPYITHCLTVAETVANWRLDESSIAAALLHDVVEDTKYTHKEIEKMFGQEVAFLVDGLTKLDTIQYPKKDPNIENLRKLIVSFSKDLRVIIIKLADRLHNMQTLQYLPRERQQALAWETTEIYAPLAYRLGMQKLSGELEDLAFPYLYPEEYEWLIDNVTELYEERQAYGEKIKPTVAKLLESHNIKTSQIDSRAKRYSSLYKKLLRYDMQLDKIYDLVAMRIIVNTVEECYTVLGIIHQEWSPLPGRIKDYIARPKPNGYRSLHTTVFCTDHKITEFQIRTQEMHEEDELGIAAHWAYQQIKSSKEHARNWLGVRSRRELLWIEQLRNWQKAFTNQKDFIESLKIDFFKDRIFVITPHNDVVDLPTGATPIDFAYQIHSDVGNACVGAKINGKIVPLDYELQSGDLVEIITQRGRKPSKDWLRFAKTSLAKKQIRSALQDKDHNLDKKDESHIEFKIVNEDRPGYLKDITAAFGDLKINITHLTSTTDHRHKFSSVTAKCEPISKDRLERALVKIKKIPGTREISYKFNR